ncbi:DUF1947 domain-containing protein [Candidatus Woesearchaeota archaeon]|nr:DUF1947 domain-containing protein [Candidatus Woesearchaeota archaeon]
MKVKTLNKSGSKELLEEINKLYNVEPFSKKDKVELVEDEYKYVKVNNEVLFFYHENKIVPTLKLLLKNNFLKTITVDMGAIKYVANGSDVMRPGITNINSEIKKDDYVSIIDEQNKRPIAIGKAIFDADELKSQQTGKSILSIHYVGDKIWKL